MIGMAREVLASLRAGKILAFFTPPRYRACTSCNSSTQPRCDVSKLGKPTERRNLRRLGLPRLLDALLTAHPRRQRNGAVRIRLVHSTQDVAPFLLEECLAMRDAIRGHQRPSAAISGHQRPSAVISAPAREVRAAACVASRPTRAQWSSRTGPPCGPPPRRRGRPRGEHQRLRAASGSAS
jgi:hypothetical protein